MRLRKERFFYFVAVCQVKTAQEIRKTAHTGEAEKKASALTIQKILTKKALKFREREKKVSVVEYRIM